MMPVWKPADADFRSLALPGRRLLNISTALSAARPTSNYPGLFEGTHPVEPEKTRRSYHLTEALADKAIQ